jgi:hypothetical protein
MQETETMAKTKIDDLPKGAEEMDAEEQKAAKGGATIASKYDLRAQTLAATTTVAKPTLGDRAVLESETLKSKIVP